MNPISQNQAQQALGDEAEQVRQPDLEKLLKHQQRIERKVRSSGRLARFGTDIRLMLNMLKDYWQGNYRSVPWKSIAAIAGALIYVLNPLDLIPDLVFGFGLIDDAGVVAACIAMVEADLHRYAAWKSLADDEGPTPD